MKGSARVADPVLRDFVEETVELLARIEDVELGGDPSRIERSAGEVELALHTIKGNAGAFGFSDLSDAASGLLDRVRRARERRETSWFSGDGRMLLAEIVDRGRELIGCIEKGAAPRPELFRGIADGLAREARRSEPAGSAGAGRAAAGGSADVARILAAAPPVAPRIREIVDLARRELERERSGISGGFCPDEEVAAIAPPQKPVESIEIREEPRAPEPRRAPAPPAAAAPPAPLWSASAGAAAVEVRRPADATPRSEAAAPVEAMGPAPGDGTPPERRVRGFVFEASCLQREVAALLDGDVDPSARPLLAKVCDFLVSFASSGGSAGQVSAANVMLSASGGWRALETATGSRISLEVAEPGAALLPALADLLWRLLAEICRSPASPPAPDAAGGAVLRLSRGGDRWVATLRGLRGGFETTAKVRVFQLRRFVEDLGGAIRIEAPDGMSVELPANFQVIDVLTARTGESEVGFPAHRVVGVLDSRSFAAGGPSGPRSISFGGRSVDVVDLTAGAGGGGAEGWLVVLGSGRRLQAIRVDDALARAEMLVQMPSTRATRDGILAYCVKPDGWRRFPLLCAAIV